MTETERLLLENPSLRAWWHLARSYHLIVARLTELLSTHGITGAQFGVLRCVSDAGPDGLMLSDLSRRLMVTCGNITGVVDRLEQAGYLRRERQSCDRRVVRALLTPAGHDLFVTVWPEVRELLAELMQPHLGDDVESLGDLCARLDVGLLGARNDVLVAAQGDGR